MNLFRGYIRTNGKAGAEPFKDVPDDELRTLDSAKKCKSYAGVLAADTVLLDVDNHVESEILMRIVEENELLCRVYETKRGKHFYFKNNGIERNATGALLACGIHADIKIGTRSSIGTLKVDGVERKILVFMRTVAVKTAAAGELRLAVFPAADINRRAGNALVAVKVERSGVSGTVGGIYSTAIDNRRVEALVPIEGRVLLTVEIS